MLSTIHHLPASDFVRCWLEIVHAHRLLWQEGIYHLDPSLANTMVRMVDGTYRGVLNDWDLSNLREELKHGQLELTGTRVFMAVNLMDTDGGLRDGRVQRLYRHDLEGFVWILPWVFAQFDDENKAYKTKLMMNMQSPLMDTAKLFKTVFLHPPYTREHVPQKKWQVQWELALRLCEMFGQIHLGIQPTRTRRTRSCRTS
ncbi:hypothetical protein C8T65DRAFT_14358 [Cerioporus squamosus]|nr:hypothetical protein C8T65DRAFT_14358 [Cerioporus squamosus]